MPLLRQFRRLQGLIATEICFIAAVFLLGRASAQNCQPGFGLADSIGPGCQQLVTPKIDFNGKITNQQMPIPEYVAVVGQDFVLNLGVEGANVLGLATQVERADDWLPDFSAMTTGTTMAVLTMMPKEPQAGTQYTACAKAMPTAPGTVVFEPLLVCARIKVEKHAASFTANATDPAVRSPPPDMVIDAYVGVMLTLPLEVSAMVAASPSAPPPSSSAPPSVRALPTRSYPLSPTGLPPGAELARRPEVTDADPLQLWTITWTPKVEDTAGVPQRVCVQAMVEEEEGEERCYGVKVHKCRHGMRGGETLESVAVQYHADWLQLHHANPNLPSLNPDKTHPGLLVRLGVTYAVRFGEDLARVAQKFLVEPRDLGLVNPELLAPTTIAYTPGTAGHVTQLDLSLTPRRRVMAGENLTLSLPTLDGAPWRGPVFEGCTPVAAPGGPQYCPPPVLQRSNPAPGCCDPATHRPQSKCGAGGWGRCQYDPQGVMACHVLACAEAPHPAVAAVTWTGEQQRMLIITLRSDLHAGQQLHVTVPRSAGLGLARTEAPVTEAEAHVPLSETSWDPTSMMHVPTEVCVVLPMCHRDLDCVFGSDCNLRASRQ